MVATDIDPPSGTETPRGSKACKCKSGDIQDGEACCCSGAWNGGDCTCNDENEPGTSEQVECRCNPDYRARGRSCGCPASQAGGPCGCYMWTPEVQARELALMAEEEGLCPCLVTPDSKCHCIGSLSGKCRCDANRMMEEREQAENSESTTRQDGKDRISPGRKGGCGCGPAYKSPVSYKTFLRNMFTSPAVLGALIGLAPYIGGGILVGIGGGLRFARWSSKYLMESL